MKSKIEMAHDYAMALVLSPDFDDDMSLSAFVKHVWKYADKMQAEEDKRKVGGVPDALLTKDENGNCTHFHTTFGRGECFDCGKSLKEEFQPDWSKAPDGYSWWAFDGFSKKANWYNSKPYIDDEAEGDDEWNIELQADTKVFLEAPSFGYQGDWKDSLRKRP